MGCTEEPALVVCTQPIICREGDKKGEKEDGEKDRRGGGIEGGRNKGMEGREGMKEERREKAI